MTFSYIDLNLLSDEEYIYLLSINKWINKEEQSEVYVVKYHDDIKSVFCLKQNGINAELSFDTEISIRNKIYFSFGFYNILEIIKSNPSIKNTIFVSSNKYVDLLCKKENIPNISINIYDFDNPNFDYKYAQLEKMIINKASLEELINFCSGDEVMIEVLNFWLRRNNINKNNSVYESSDNCGKITKSYSK